MKYLLMIVLLFSFRQAGADKLSNFYIGNRLLELCEAIPDIDTAQELVMGSTCQGFIMGVADAHNAFVEWKEMEQRWCMPAGIGGAQLVRVVTKHLQENPQELHMTAGSMVANAIILAFPCE